mmetsp:Transcript_41825/g.53893  ORF Transcript_41825/g.53893 Transcript_41825/m.53893 type:complete len:121 (-) Transcript_41825:319-681(-)
MKKASFNNRQSCEFCSSLYGNIVLKACSRCRLVFYCSKECQTKHWKSGHKKLCIPVNDRRVSNQVPSDTSVNRSASETSGLNGIICAICLDSVKNNQPWPQVCQRSRSETRHCEISRVVY